MSEKNYRVSVPETEHWRKMVKCQYACPVNTDARAYVTAVARGELEEGYRIAHDPNPLSTVCGRICGAPCETACRRGWLEPDYKPVAIRPLKRVLTERHGPESATRTPARVNAGELLAADALDVVKPGEVLSRDEGLKKTNGTVPGTGAADIYSPVRWSREELIRLAAQPGRKTGKVAVIGAGPSGMAVAHDLALLGHKVTVYEAGPKTGGMMRYGVPVYRVEQEAMDAESQAILDLGVEIRYNTPT